MVTPLWGYFPKLCVGVKMSDYTSASAISRLARKVSKVPVHVYTSVGGNIAVGFNAGRSQIPYSLSAVRNFLSSKGYYVTIAPSGDSLLVNGSRKL